MALLRCNEILFSVINHVASNSCIYGSVSSDCFEPLDKPFDIQQYDTNTLI